MKELDVRGEICPYPMTRASQALRQLSAEEDGLIVRTDHAPALGTVPWEAAKLGYESELESVGPAEWLITLRRAQQQRSQQEVLADLSRKIQAVGGNRG